MSVPCQKYITISLIRHSRKVMVKILNMVKIILNGFKPKAELPKNMLGSEPEGAPQNRSSTLESYVKSTSNKINKICTCLQWLQKALWQSMACSLLGHHAEVQYQCKSTSHHWAALHQGYKCSPGEWQHGRMVKNNSRNKARMSSVTHPLQHLSPINHVWCSDRTWWKG